MIDRTHALPVKRQAQPVGISRGTASYHPEPVSEIDLRLMRRIDKLHLELPFGFPTSAWRWAACDALDAPLRPITGYPPYSSSSRSSPGSRRSSARNLSPVGRRTTSYSRDR